jgi:hypothetical protein
MVHSNNSTYAKVSIESEFGAIELGETPLTIFEDSSGVEARLTVNVDTESFKQVHALDHYLNKTITFRQTHRNGVVFIARIKCNKYERRLDSKYCRVVHVFTGVKTPCSYSYR